MPSLYAQYVSEREGISTIERDYGFATYMCNYDIRDLFICDFFVTSSKRKQGKSAELLKLTENFARSENLLSLSCAVRVGSPNSEAAISGLIKYGFKCVNSDLTTVYFKLKLSAS